MQVYDLFISLDCGSHGTGSDLQKKCFEHAKTDAVCGSSHQQYWAMRGENYVVPDASSTSELICRDDRLWRGWIGNIAEALYVGIAHDTGVFLYSCYSSPETMEVAADLLRTGLDANATDRSVPIYQQDLYPAADPGAGFAGKYVFAGQKMYCQCHHQKSDGFLRSKGSQIWKELSVSFAIPTGVEVAIFHA